MNSHELRRLTYFSHMALGFSGAVFFCVLIGGAFYLLPRVESLLAHADTAASNATTATGIWANSAASQAHQVQKIADDARASIVATGRLADKLTELAATTKGQVQQLGPLLASVKTASDSIAPAVDKIGTTAEAGTALLKTTTTTFAQFNDPDHGVSPIMATYLKSGQDLNAILERQAIGKMLDSFAGIAHNGDLITGQFELVTKKASSDYLGPHPWYTKLGRFASDTYDYGALLARHAP